jgi:hypothetical protein
MALVASKQLEVKTARASGKPVLQGLLLFAELQAPGWSMFAVRQCFTRRLIFGSQLFYKISLQPCHRIRESPEGADHRIAHILLRLRTSRTTNVNKLLHTLWSIYSVVTQSALRKQLQIWLPPACPGSRFTLTASLHFRAEFSCQNGWIVLLRLLPPDHQA